MPVDKNKWTARDLRSFVSRRRSTYYRDAHKFNPNSCLIGDSDIKQLTNEISPPDGSKVRYWIDGDNDIRKFRLLQCLDHIIRVHGPDAVVWQKGGSSSGSGGSSEKGEYLIVEQVRSSGDETKVGPDSKVDSFVNEPCATSASVKPDQLHQCQDQYQRSSSLQSRPTLLQDERSFDSEKSGNPANSSGGQKEGTDPLDRFWGKVTERSGDPKTDGSSQLSDDPNCDGSDTDRESLTSNGSTGLNDRSGARRDVPEAKKRSGGYYTNKDRVEEERRKIEARARKEIYRALYKLLRAVDIGGLDCSPRLEGAKLVREIVYKRYSLARTKRDELEKSVAFIAVDNSGSCSACCDAMLATALEVHRENQDKIHIILHSNGWVSDEHGNETGEELDKAVIRLAEGKKVAAVVAFGDWDAGDQYKRIAESGVPLIWLDHNNSNEFMPCPIDESMRARDWKIDPLFHWDGIYDPKTTAIAFREMARKIKRAA